MKIMMIIMIIIIIIIIIIIMIILMIILMKSGGPKSNISLTFVIGFPYHTI